MIERAWYLKEHDISEDEKQVTAQYFAALSSIQEKSRAERDAKRKAEEAIKDNG